MFEEVDGIWWSITESWLGNFWRIRLRLNDDEGDDKGPVFADDREGGGGGGTRGRSPLFDMSSQFFFLQLLRWFEKCQRPGARYAFLYILATKVHMLIIEIPYCFILLSSIWVLTRARCDRASSRPIITNMRRRRTRQTCREKTWTFWKSMASRLDSLPKLRQKTWQSK